jgi:hypothetical protein
MIGVAAILTGDPSLDPCKYLGRAHEHYARAAAQQQQQQRGGGGGSGVGGSSRQARMLATRVMMTAADYQAALGR